MAASDVSTRSPSENSSTIFVRNLPYSATKEQLEEVFSQVGPVKKSFVVTEKGVTEKCRGFGYVTYALREDAEKALKVRLFLAARKLYTSYSRRKDSRKTGKEKKGVVEEKEEADHDDDAGKEMAAEEVKASEQAKTLDSPRKGGLYVGGGSTPLKQRNKGETSMNEDKRGRLIVRNLAFKCSEKRLQKAFAHFGNITQVHIPCDPKNPSKVRGYGFVQFSSVENAAEAVKKMNAQEIMGRPVAVDWSLSQDRYLTASKKNKMVSKVEEDVESDDEEEESDDESGVESSSDVEDTRDDNDEEDDDDDEDDDEDDDDDDDDEDNEDDSSSEDEGVASNEDGKRKINQEQELKTAKLRNTSSDVDQGRTVFIRNVLFETTEDEIRELFAHFGEVTYSKLVVDRATEHSKGTAFVKFATQEGAKRCLQKAKCTNEGEDSLVLGGRQLLVSLALGRDEASKLREVKKEKQKAEKKDKRNMYLLQEGFIRPGTIAAEGMTDSDVAKRTKLESIKRLKLKNINIFVSTTRVAIHNLPKAVDDKKLKETLLTAAGDKRAKVIESRVMRDMKTPTPQGQAKSLGFAFAEFTKHEHALAALRKMNNSTEYFVGARRLIVGFSLENRLALEAKQRRQERSLFKARQIRIMQTAKDSKSKEKATDQKRTSSRTRTPKPKKGVLPPPPSSKLEQRMQSKSKMTVHVGAKRRWRDRGKAEETKKGKRRERLRQFQAESGRKLREPAKPKAKQRGGEGGMQKSRRHKDSAEDIKFDKLVASYKHKLFSRQESGHTLKKSKWYEER